MLAPTLINLALITLSLIQPGTATCYDYNGKIQSSEWQPCASNSGSISTCCATNRKNPFGGAVDSNGQNSDRCLSNGLCQSQVTVNSANVTSYFRNGCTADSPDDKWCLNKVCAADGNPDWGGSAEMTPCDGTPDSKLWCCGRTTACCGKPTQWELPTTLGAAVPALGRIESSSSISSSSTSPPTSSPTTSPNFAPTTSQSPPNPSLPTGSSPPIPTPMFEKQSTLAAGAIAGIVVACVVAIAAIVAVIFFKRRWDAKRKKLEEKVVRARQAQEVSQNATYEYWGHRIDTSSPPLEMSLNDDNVHELHSDATPQEMGLDPHGANRQEVKNMV